MNNQKAVSMMSNNNGKGNRPQTVSYACDNGSVAISRKLEEKEFKKHGVNAKEAWIVEFTITGKETKLVEVFTAPDKRNGAVTMFQIVNSTAYAELK